MEDLLKDLPCRNRLHFSSYHQDSYKGVDAKKCISLKNQQTDQLAQIIITDSQSVLRCELEKRQNSQKQKKPTKRLSADETSSPEVRTKLRKTISEESTNDDRESD